MYMNVLVQDTYLTVSLTEEDKKLLENIEYSDYPKGKKIERGNREPGILICRGAILGRNNL